MALMPLFSENAHVIYQLTINRRNLVKLSQIILLVIVIFIPALSQAGNYVLVEENRAEIVHSDVTYILNTYIIMFEQPYYISVERKDGMAVDPDIAEKIALIYIKPRGCTEPLERRKDLDQQHEEQTKLVIGVAC